MKLIGEDLMRQAYTRLGQDPNADITDILHKAEQVDPEKAKTIREYKDTVLTLGTKVYEKPEAIAKLYQGFYDGTAGIGDIMDLVNQKGLAPDKIPYAFRDMDMALKHKDILEQPSIGRVVTDMSVAISGGELFPDKTKTLQALDAKNTLRRGLIDFAEKNPNATPTQQYEEAVRLQTLILKSIPETNKVGTTLPPSARPVAASPVSPAAQVKPLYATSDDLKAGISSGRVAIQAETLGMTPEEFIKAQVKAIKQQTPKKK
jgi:hypothetical protein